MKDSIIVIIVIIGCALLFVGISFWIKSLLGG